MFKSTLPAALIALLPVAAAAQSVVDVAALTALEDIDVVTAGGDEVGDVEDALIGDNGSIVALVVEVGGFIDIGGEDRVVPMDRLTFRNGDFVTDLTAQEAEALPEWDD